MQLEALLQMHSVLKVIPGKWVIKNIISKCVALVTATNAFLLPYIC